MFFASVSSVPSWFVLLTLSEPAKSTRFNLDTKQVSFSNYRADITPKIMNSINLNIIFIPSKVSVKMQCDLEEH